MFKFGLPLAVLLASAAPVCAQTPPQVKPATKILHENLIVLDTHFDTPANQAVGGFDIRKRNNVADGSQVDYPRMVEGGVDGGFFAIYTPQGPNTKPGTDAARDQAIMRGVVIHEMVAKNSDVFALATTAE
ncbi:membrane dipeptidase, partial [Phenylobacterium sp.]|uniref:membrane dipeptidase n=1 Tax=Phenylobacterium sp. TaxID=1871053 RepID=UPI002733301B